MSAEFPTPFSEVLVRLREVLGSLRDHVVATSATALLPAQSGQEETALATGLPLEPGAGEGARGVDALHETGSAGLEAVAAGLRDCVQSLESSGRLPLALLLQGCEKALPSLQPGHPRHAPEARQVIEQALLTVLRQAERPVADELALVSELFPPYAAVQMLGGVERVHPADLWPGRHPLLGLPSDPFAVPRALDPEARLALEETLLKTLKQPGPEAFRAMSDLCAGLGEGAAGAQSDLWKLAGAVYEAQADDLLSADVYLKRMGPRLLSLARATLSNTEAPAPVWASDRSARDAQGPAHRQARAQDSARQLGHELLYRCHCALAAAQVPGRAAGPRLVRVATACGMASGITLQEAALPADAASDGEAATVDVLLGAERDVAPAPAVGQAGAAPPEVWRAPAEDAGGDEAEGAAGEGGWPADEAPPLDLVLPLERSAGSSPAPHQRLAGQRSLAEAVPGLPSATDLDLDGWGPAANADLLKTPADEIKVIGPLRLDIPVFTAFLNDADEASRRLSMVLAEWADAPEAPVPAEAAVQAFALAQGADRVGHEALAALAHQLVRVLRTSAAQPLPPVVAAAPVWAARRFTAAAEEMRRVLHQFAAGFLTEPSPDCARHLEECLAETLPSFLSPQRGDGPEAPPLSDGWEVQSLHDLASLQTELASALDRLAQVRPSRAAAASDLAVADQRFDRAWSEANDRLAAADGLVRSLLDRPRPPRR